MADVSSETNRAVDAGARVIVEGTQGYGLSLHHGEYPYVTSRDTTAAAFLSEVGLSPLCVDEVVMVIRTFPIRVGGPSGPLPKEMSWEQLRLLSGYPYPIAEHTSVTGRLRRVAAFDWTVVERAVSANRPTAIALHGLDYLSFENRGVMQEDALTANALDFVSEVERRLGVEVRVAFTGPRNRELVDRREPCSASSRGQGERVYA